MSKNNQIITTGQTSPCLQQKLLVAKLAKFKEKCYYFSSGILAIIRLSMLHYARNESQTELSIKECKEENKSEVKRLNK